MVAGESVSRGCAAAPTPAPAPKPIKVPKPVPTPVPVPVPMKCPGVHAKPTPAPTPCPVYHKPPPCPTQPPKPKAKIIQGVPAWWKTVTFIEFPILIILLLLVCYCGSQKTDGYEQVPNGGSTRQ